MMDVVAWRREKRIELYTARKAMTAEQRHEAARRIAGRLDDHCIRRKPELVGLYWPIKYEPNLLAWARVSNLRFCLPRDGTWRRPT
jgi:5-formyltetrahydrofolate cyclo-ligase